MHDANLDKAQHAEDVLWEYYKVSDANSSLRELTVDLIVALMHLMEREGEFVPNVIEDAKDIWYGDCTLNEGN